MTSQLQLNMRKSLTFSSQTRKQSLRVSIRLRLFLFFIWLFFTVVFSNTTFVVKDNLTKWKIKI